MLRRVLLWASLPLLSAATQAATLPWQRPGAVPLPRTARSVLVLRHQEALRLEPGRDSRRRGSVALGARLPLYGAQRGAGCHGTWLNVGPLAWICSSHTQFSPAPAWPPGHTPRRVGAGLPHHYYVAGPGGSLGYERLSLAGIGSPAYAYDPGFVVAILQRRHNSWGDPFGLTTKQLWVPLGDFRPVQPFHFRGVALQAGNLNVGWVVVTDARPRRSANGRRVPGTYSRFQSLQVLERKRLQQRWWYRVGEQRWLSEQQLKVPQAAIVPDTIREGERWIDVDLEHQVVTAYAGSQPIFATLSSTGRGRGKSPLATPKGRFRIWAKLITTDMTNLQDHHARRYYALEEVPWVMFFKQGYGLHGAFWHRRFGHRQSHGCVNLAPLDAQWLFHWSSPRLPPGWTAALPTPYEPGTLVRVR